jgi:NADH-quinone oxidoreductase subunit L
MGLIVGIILIYLTFLSLDFEIVLSLVPFFLDETIYLLNYEINMIELIGILIFIGAMGKSAQLGLHT